MVGRIGEWATCLGNYSGVLTAPLRGADLVNRLSQGCAALALGYSHPVPSGTGTCGAAVVRCDSGAVHPWLARGR